MTGHFENGRVTANSEEAFWIGNGDPVVGKGDVLFRVIDALDDIGPDVMRRQVFEPFDGVRGPAFGRVTVSC